MSVVFPAGQLKILPYNRVVRDLAGMDESEFLEKLSKVCTVTQSGEKSPTAPNFVDMYLGKKWYTLKFENTSSLGAVEGLDVSLLQDRVLVADSKNRRSAHGRKDRFCRRHKGNRRA